VRFFEGTWPDPGSFDLIVANLPYVPSGDDVAPEVRDWEPAGALFPGETGLECFRDVLHSLSGSGVRTASIALEVGHDQGESVASLLRETGFEQIAVHPDLAGLERMVTGHMKSRS
jgi:release factor glutamine methyltransferase